MSARSFCTPLSAADGLARPLAATRGEVSSPAGGLVFVSGAATQELDRIADQVRAAWRGVPVCIVPAGGVLSERVEIEGASAASGVLWSGGRATPFSVGDGASAGDVGDTLAAASTQEGAAAARRTATALVFARSDFASDMLEGVTSGSTSTTFFGAGTVGAAAIALSPSGEILRGRAAGLVLHGLASPLVQSTAACRLVTSFTTVEEVSGGLVLRVGGSAALDALSSCVPEIRGGGPQGASPQPPPVVFVALADPPGPSSDADERYVVRPLRGIDPTRRGVMVGPDVKPGARIAFAIRDASAARKGLEAAVSKLSEQARGSVPRFALFLTCAGRGQGLYGTPDVESRILRQAFRDLPIAGMHSAFEIVPWAPGEARLALYTGVLALFRSPS
jgi:small ligand-binding sensory domain FIST